MNQNNTPTQPTTSSLNPFNIIAGLISDTVEAAKYIGSEIEGIPGAMADGWNNGAILDTDNSKALKAANQPTQPIQTQVTPDITEPFTVTEVTDPIDPKDAQIAALRAELDALTRAQ